MTFITSNIITSNHLSVGTITTSSTNIRLVSSSTPVYNPWNTGTNIKVTPLWGPPPKKKPPRCSGCGRWAKVVNTNKIKWLVDCKRCMGEMPRRY